MMHAIFFITCCGKQHFGGKKNWSNRCQQQQEEKTILLQREQQFIPNKSQGRWPILGLYRPGQIRRWSKLERLGLRCGLDYEEGRGLEHKSHRWKGVWNEAGKTRNWVQTWLMTLEKEDSLTASPAGVRKATAWAPSREQCESKVGPQEAD